MWVAIPASKQSHQYLKDKGFTHINHIEDIGETTEFIMFDLDLKHYCYASWLYSKILLIQLNQLDQVLAMRELLLNDPITFKNLVKELSDAN